MKKLFGCLLTTVLLIVTTVCVLFALLVIIGTTMEPPATRPRWPQSPVPAPPASQQGAVEATPEPMSAEDLWEMRRRAAIDTITGYTLVRRASLTQQGDTIKLQLGVNPIATDDHAHNLGDNFVRITKSLLDEGHPPRKRIGPGNYDYHITVYWWPDKAFDQGEKPADEHDLRW